MIIVIQVMYKKSIRNECQKNICLSSSVYVHVVTCICLSTIKLGTDHAENVSVAVYKSRKTLIVMSKNFLNDMWGRFALSQAQTKEAMVGVTVINHVIYL